MFAQKHAAVTLGFGSLTQHSDEGLGSSHRHSEDGAGVLALIRQGHIADADAELMGCGFNQLNPIISKGWGELGEWEARLLLAPFMFIFNLKSAFCWDRGVGPV